VLVGVSVPLWIVSLNHALAIVLALIWFTAAPLAVRMGYPPEEFSARRSRLATALERGTLVMFGATDAGPGIRFRQDNDFFYLTGNEALNAVLVVDAPGGQSHLFIPKLSPTEIRYEGGNWLDEADGARAHGFASVQPLSGLHEFLARRRGISGPLTLWTRLSERDEVNFGRVDAAIRAARRLNNPFAQQIAADAVRIQQLREMFPYYTLQDATPHIDRLRLIKTPREIEILRENGRVSAEAMRRAIEVTAPGRYEYEHEAEATHWMLKHGLQGAAYPAIVASGPNGNQWHYESNGRQTKAGDLIVMDYGGSLDYLTIDITRTWPVSGRFTDPQRRAYDATLEAQKAIIAAIRPGVTRDVVRAIAEDVFRIRGFDPRYAYVGHYVGLSVHDVGDWGAPFEAGMVMAIEPILDLPEQQMHVRVEDTILVTSTGAEVLTSGVPKDASEILGLIRTPATR
jgi:Xaa-Pro aminopeptidase